MECEAKIWQKSDYLIVVMKPVKVGGAKGGSKSAFSQSKAQVTQEVTKKVAKELRGIRHQSKTYKKVANTCGQYQGTAPQTNSKKAVGVDGVTKTDYGENLDESVDNLIARMKKFSYKPQPVRRAFIPKADGRMRPLGIPSYEDRLVQGVMAVVLNNIYEERFLDCFYGFRPNRSAHQAVREINQTIMTRKVNYVLEADIKGFFDNVNHDWLMKFLEHDIADKYFLRYVKRFLIAGVMDGTQRQESDKGSPQGGQISPVLANVYLHYVLDLWFVHELKKQCRGEVYYVRYADDFVIMFQYENEAGQAMEMLKTRLAKFGLEVAEDKTRTLPIGRFKGTKESFDFLGFTFYNIKTRTGKHRMGVKTSKSKLKVKKQTVKAWLKTRLI